MPPVGRPLKHDGPACRVCGCTENNACIDRVYVGIGPVMCHWVKVEGATEPLCSACSGTEADIVEVTGRCSRMLKQHGGQVLEFVQKALAAALARRVRRHKAAEKA